MVDLAGQKYWDKVYEESELSLVSKNNPVRLWIEQFIPETENGRCIEIGCYPGRFLPVFGELGYELNGIDYSPKISAVSEWLTEKSYRVGTFWQEDFLDFRINQKFDVVVSLGFIEHFTNWEEVLEKHLSLVKKEGYLVLVVPNFIGWIQRFIHKVFDKGAFDIHNITAMNVEKWVDILAPYNFETIQKGYFGGFDFWLDEKEHALLKKFFLYVLIKSKPLLKKILSRDNKMYSPFGGVIAQRCPVEVSEECPEVLSITTL